MVTVSETIHTLYLFGITLGIALLISEIFRRLEQSEVVGQVFVGILLGPYVLGVIRPNEIFEFIAELGAIILLFIAGLETDVKELSKSSLAAGLLALFGVILSFIPAFIILYPITMNAVLSFYISAALCATSVGITVRVFSEFGKLKSREAQTVIAAAVVDDVISVFLLTLAINFATAKELGFQEVFNIVWSMIVFFLAMLGLSVIITTHVVPRLWRLKVRGAVLIFSITLAILAGYAAAQIGLSPIIGAYIAGLMLAETGLKDEILRDVSPIAFITVPVFLVNIGLKVNINALWKALFLGTILSIVAILGKILSGYPVMKVIKNDEKPSPLLLGSGMVPRGEVGFIFATIGLTIGVLNDYWYANLVYVILVTTFIAPILLRFLLKRGGE
ncbi:MAG: cation:proton antiporter [Candidatus Njordarchaeales archaeon]